MLASPDRRRRADGAHRRRRHEVHAGEQRVGDPHAAPRRRDGASVSPSPRRPGCPGRRSPARSPCSSPWGWSRSPRPTGPPRAPAGRRRWCGSAPRPATSLGVAVSPGTCADRRGRPRRRVHGRVDRNAAPVEPAARSRATSRRPGCSSGPASDPAGMWHVSAVRARHRRPGHRSRHASARACPRSPVTPSSPASGPPGSTHRSTWTTTSSSPPRGSAGAATPHAEDSLVFIDWGERIGAGIVLRWRAVPGRVQRRRRPRATSTSLVPPDPARRRRPRPVRAVGRHPRAAAARRADR